MTKWERVLEYIWLVKLGLYETATIKDLKQGLTVLKRDGQYYWYDNETPNILNEEND